MGLAHTSLQGRTAAQRSRMPCAACVSVMTASVWPCCLRRSTMDACRCCTGLRSSVSLAEVVAAGELPWPQRVQSVTGLSLRLQLALQ